MADVVDANSDSTESVVCTCYQSSDQIGVIRFVANGRSILAVAGDIENWTKFLLYR